MSCADLSLGIHPKAWAILHLLNGMPPDFARWDHKAKKYDLELKTYPWYNGRERGFVLVLQRTVGDKTALHVAFSECRTSDKVFVEVWVDKTPWNITTYESCDKEVHGEAYDTRRTFISVQEATDYIVKKLGEYYKEVPHVS